MNKLTTLTKRFAQTTALLGLMIGTAAPAYADLRLDISDLTDGIPTVAASGTTSTTVTILPDSAPDFLHFTFTYSPAAFTSIFSSDLLEPVSNALSDRFLISFTQGSTLWDVQFDSRDTILLPRGAQIQFVGVETGESQLMFGAQIGGPVLSIFAASDPNETTVPEPSTILLIALALSAMGIATGRNGRAPLGTGSGSTFVPRLSS